MPNHLPDPPDAVAWAHEVPPGEATARLLEGHLLQKEPALFKALGGRVFEEAKAVTRPPGGESARRTNGPLMAALFLLLLAPIAGIAGFFTGTRTYTGSGSAGIPTEELPVNTQITLAVVFFWVSVLIPVVLLLAWWRSGRVRDQLTVWVLCYVVVLGLVAIVGLATRDVELSGASEMIPVYLAIGLSAVVLLIVLVCSAPASSWLHQVIDVLGEPEVERAQALVDAMDETRRRELLAARDESLAVLTERGLVTSDVRERARELPLGQLARVAGWSSGRVQ